MQLKLVLSFLAALTLAGCVKTANVALGDAVTSRGIINRAELELGQVYIWDRTEDSATRLLTIDVPQSDLSGSERNARNVEVSFERGVELTANAALSRVLNEDLEIQLRNEARNRTRLRTLNSRQIELANPYSTLEEYIDANPSDWYNAMESVGVNNSNNY